MQNKDINFENFSVINEYIANSTFEDALANQALYTRDKRYKEYKDIFRDNGLISRENTINTWFEWTQCEDPQYNKYYIKLLKDLYENIDQYKLTYNLLSDDTSRIIYSHIVFWRLTLRSSKLIESYLLSKHCKQYLDPIAKLGKDEVIVDGGGYIGDSTADFIEELKEYKRIFLFEPDRVNIEQAKTNLNGYKNITFINAGLGNKGKTALFNGQGLSSSSFTDNISEGELVNIVSIDETLHDKVTFIKMDVEGMELEALRGGAMHIQADRPVLAICLYHNVEDIYKIPLYIRELVANYKFFIRHYTAYHGETVLYAVPEERFMLKREKEM